MKQPFLEASGSGCWLLWLTRHASPPETKSHPSRGFWDDILSDSGIKEVTSEDNVRRGAIHLIRFSSWVSGKKWKPYLHFLLCFLFFLGLSQLVTRIRPVISDRSSCLFSKDVRESRLCSRICDDSSDEIFEKKKSLSDTSRKSITSSSLVRMRTYPSTKIIWEINSQVLTGYHRSKVIK